MVQLDGKYQLTRTENFLEFVSGQGPEEAARISKAHSLLTVVKDGNKVTISDISGATPLSKTYIIGETNEEELIKDVKVQTSVTLEGGKLSLNSSSTTEKLQRVYEFSDDGLTISYTSSRNATAKRHFKRV